MRRSAAPSFQSGGPGKRIKFSSPLLSNNKKSSPTPLPLRDLNDIVEFINPVENGCKSDADKENEVSHSNSNQNSETTNNILKMQPLHTFKAPVKKFVSPDKEIETSYNNFIQHPETTNNQLKMQPPRTFKAPVKKDPHVTGLQATSKKVEECQKINDFEHRYFTAMWTKFSKKKHKTWDGDGILITSKSSLELRDQDNKVIAKKSQCKSADILNLFGGSSMIMGGKEVLIDEEISKDAYTSGTCFISASTPIQSSAFISNKCTPKGFACPQKNNSLSSQRPIKSKPRHDPTYPNAVVLQPGTNDKVAVVLDPYLADKMRQHQLEGVQFVYKCVMGLAGKGCGAVLADDMGLGKTLQAIAMIWTLLKQGPSGSPVCKKCLIITPSSLVMNWKQEFKKWLGDERIKVWALSAGESQVNDFINSPLHSVLVISYEMFRKSVANVLEVDWGIVVCDEGHRLKNMNAKIGEALCKLPCKRRVILTGTPVQNNLKEFYTLVNFVNPGVLGTPSAFNNVFADPIQLSQLPSATTNQQNLGKARSLELSKITSQFILRRTNEINERYLPPKEEKVLFCKASPLLVERYSLLLDNLQLYHINSSDILQLILTLKKLCNHPCLVPLGKEEDEVGNVREVNVKDSTKLAVTAGLVKQHISGGSKVVLVSNYTQTLDLLGHMCDSLNVQYHRLDGSTQQAKRQNLVDLFNSNYDTKQVFLLSSKAGGVGLNLIGGNILVLYDIDWNPANDLQAMARVWRDGQKKRVTIYRLVTTGTIEEKILQRQVRKRGLSKCVVDKGEEQCSFTQSQLKDIFSYNFTTDSVTHELLQCNCNGNYKPSEGDVRSETVESTEVAPETEGEELPGVVNRGLMELMQWEHSYHTDPALVSFVFSKHTNVSKM